MKKLLLYLLPLLLLGSCTDNFVYSEQYPVGEEGWHKDDIAVFRVPVKDTTSAHRFFFTLRNGGDYPFSNMHLFLTTHFPDSSMAVDSIEILLATPSGEWLGEGSGNVIENKVLFRENVVFPDTGVYVFTVRHGMRMDVLPDVYDAGLRIELQ